MLTANKRSYARWFLLMISLAFLPGGRAWGQGRALSLSWRNEMLTIRGADLPGGELSVWYLEAFCRPGSTDRDWKDTVIPHKTRLMEATADGRLIRLRSVLDDGVTVDHEIRAGIDEVDFRVVAANPTTRESLAHWAQPCIRVDGFTGTKAVHGSEAYLPSCFIFVREKLVRMPTEHWATHARYTPGQVWCPADVNRNDVNPRPLSSIVPSNGLIGCFSADGKQIMATAWEPYQELFQGVIVCLHSDFRIGGLKPGESKNIRGKIYVMPADVNGLVARYRRDFPEHQRTADRGRDGPRRRKLIEFGWDEPDIEFLAQSSGDGTIAVRRLRLSCKYVRPGQESREPHLARLGAKKIQARRVSAGAVRPGVVVPDAFWRDGKAFRPQLSPVQCHPGRPGLVRRS